MKNVLGIILLEIASVIVGFCFTLTGIIISTLLIFAEIIDITLLVYIAVIGFIAGFILTNIFSWSVVIYEKVKGKRKWK